MSSKSAEPQPLAADQRHPLRVWSITRRLTLLYVASTTALLVLAAGFLYWTLKRNLDAARQGLVASKIEVLRLLVRELPRKAEALASEVEHEASASHLLRYYVRILDDQGRSRFETSGMGTFLPASLFPFPSAAELDSAAAASQEWRHHRTFVLVAVHARTEPTGRKNWTIQIAHDVAGSAALLADYRRKILIVLGLGLVFAAVAGVWVARQGMQPLVEITKTAQHVTATQLHARIAGSAWPAELRDLAQAFDAMLDRLEDSFTRLSQFSADLAHELRTPINNLRGEAEVALARSRTQEDYQQILASSLEEYDRLASMIEGLLFLARADDPKMAVQRVRFDARKEVEAVQDFYEALAHEQEVTVTCEGEACLIGDPLLFRRAIGNLLANALRHTPARGAVTTCLRTPNAQGVLVSVRDTGRGIAPEHLPKVFDRFNRAGLSRSQAPGGSGLGLAIVQSIMRLHGGTATVQSVLGKGTTVFLRFPAQPPPSPAGKLTEM
jgi:two-component system heavy metal sensor histidine kinase CusS